MTRTLLAGLFMVAALVACGKKDEAASSAMEKAKDDAKSSVESAKSAVGNTVDAAKDATKDATADAKADSGSAMQKAKDATSKRGSMPPRRRRPRSATRRRNSRPKRRIRSRKPPRRSATRPRNWQPTPRTSQGKDPVTDRERPAWIAVSRRRGIEHDH